MPAPKGKGLCIEKEAAKILKMAGIKDVWSKTQGQTNSKPNFIKALLQALSRLSEVKIQPAHHQKLGLAEGKLQPTKEEEFIEVLRNNKVVSETPEAKPLSEIKTPAETPKKEENA